MLSKFVDNAIKNFGKKIKVNHYNIEENINAFIQPIRYKDNSYYGGNCTAIGMNKGANYLYIGPKNVRIDQYPFDTIIETDEEDYFIKRAQKVCFKNEILYIWAILQKYEEDLD